MSLRIKIIFFAIIILNQLGECQKSPMRKYSYRIQSNDRDSIKGSIMQGVSQKYRDTIIIYLKNEKFEVKSKDNVLLADGQLLGHSCELKAHGLWIERYRNGELKEQGNYHLNEKIGTWTYGYESGKIMKIESYQRPYPIELSSHRLDSQFRFGKLQLNNKAILNGAYKEFYQNGQIKEEGQYEIIEKFLTSDTIVTFNPETYEKVYHVTEGEFWKPKSIKTGVWNYYSQTGEILKTEKIQSPISFNNNNKKFRSTRSRYLEVFQLKK